MPLLSKVHCHAQAAVSGPQVHKKGAKEIAFRKIRPGKRNEKITDLRAAILSCIVG